MARDPVQAQLEALRRGQILDAAERVFSSRGFHAARVQEVAREAGIANGTVYNYFPTKETLLLGLLDRLNETETRPAQLARLETEDPRAALVAVIRHRLELLGSHEALLRAVLPEVLANPELRARYLDEVVAPSFRLGEVALGARLPPESARRLARILAGAVLGLVVLRLLGDPGVRGDEAALAELLADRFAPALEPGGAS